MQILLFLVYLTKSGRHAGLSTPYPFLQAKLYMHKKNTEFWTDSKGFKVLNVEGAFNINNAIRYSIAKFDEKKEVLEIYAFFDIGANQFNEGQAQRRIGPQLKRVFNAERYICIATQGTRKRTAKNEEMGYIMALEFHAKCELPDPEQVGKIKDIVKGFINEQQ